jgi:hypothetical protein
MTTESKTQQLTDDEALIAGLQKHLSSTNLVVLSQSQTMAQVVATLQARVDAAQAVVDARTALHTAVAAATTADAQSASYARSVRDAVVAMYANSPAILADFNLKARKPRTPLTAAQKVLAAAKRKATRAARHTMGSVQKKAVTGSLSGSVVVAQDGTTSMSSAATSNPATTNGGSSTSH